MSKARPGSKPRKKPASTKPASMTDVAHPDTSTPSDTSKPIITHRPMIKDPMMLDKAEDVGLKPEEDKLSPGKAGGETKLTPIDGKPDEDKKEGKKKTPGDDTAQADEAEEQPDADAGEAPAQEKPGKAEDKAARTLAQTGSEEDPEIRKLVDSKKYFLPINAVEHRRSTRFAVAGVILALILAAAWVDIALDAGLIHIDGVKPVTHLFSN